MGKKEVLFDHKECATGITLSIKKPTPRYIDEFLQLKCAIDLLKAEVFPNSKEITESMAAFNAIRKLCPTLLGNHDVDLVDVGCGSTPRTAALFALRSRWSCFGVDPRVKEREYGIRRLKTMKCEIEDLVEPVTFRRSKIVVVTAVHSHASLDVTLEAIEADLVIVVAMPCCVPLEIPGNDPIAEYADWGIWSPKRTIKIYRIGNPDGVKFLY